MKRTLITSALPYSNGYIHLGHLAGAYLPADMYARFMRLSGEEVLYICGSDEHGVAITISAEREKTTPKHIIDKYHKANLEAFVKFGMSFDFYSRTSNKLHKETAIDFFEKMLKQGYLAEKEENQFYDEKAKMFLPDRYVEGTCPNCGSDKARGDQCDKCGAYYEQTELKNPISIVTKTTPQVKKTTHWYFKLGMFQEFLETYIESNAANWKENVVQQARGWLKMGLADRAITRDLDWGISIEKAKGVDAEKAKGKVLYVWFDAVLGYITATKEWALVQESKKKNNVNNTKAEDWQKWWKDEETQHIAFIGKDNIVFHTIMLPALEMAYGGFIMPANVPANEFLNLEGNKFSKSRNWSIDLRDFIANFNSPQAVDSLRYTLASILPEAKDSDFTWKDFQAKTNNELSAILGNFINRTLQFIAKYFGGRIPILSEKNSNLEQLIKKLNDFIAENNVKSVEEVKDFYSKELNQDLANNDFVLFATFAIGVQHVSELYRKFKFRDAVTETMNLARAANKYFNDEEPWKSIKENPDKCHKTLYICSQIAYSLSILFAPIVPYTSHKIQNFFISNPILGMPNNGISNENVWKKTLEFNVAAGLQIAEPTLLFAKVEDEIIEKQIAKLGQNLSENNSNNSVKNDDTKADGMISIDDFAKIKLKTAKILEAEIVPNSKKLLKLQVQIGKEKRQILAGISEFYKPEELIGKIVVVVANLRPAKLMGLESQGMMLCASEKGKVIFVTPEKAAEDGIEVR
jgi:methionyl-tRNA synthetase